jgi:hypothetical protein
MTLANMREIGVHAEAGCECGHRAIVDVEALPGASDVRLRPSLSA